MPKARPRREWFMKKPHEVQNPGAKLRPLHEVVGGTFAEEYPLLSEYLVDPAWEDGKERETATLLLLVDAGQLKGCLNDRALGRSCWVTGGSVEAVLASLELGLLEGDLPWRARPDQRSPRR